MFASGRIWGVDSLTDLHIVGQTDRVVDIVCEAASHIVCETDWGALPKNGRMRIGSYNCRNGLVQC